MKPTGVLLLVLLALGSMACFGKKYVVPNTPEGGACERECLAIKNQCVAAGGSWGCISQNEDCKRTCPGATEAQ